jgi:hypothetical protein
MKRILCLGMIVAGSTTAFAQNGPDTVLMVKLPTVKVSAERKWDNDTVRYQYNQTKYYITTILPYLNAATQLYGEFEQRSQDPGFKKKERKAFLNAKEEELRLRYEDEFTKINETQGALLMKLIARQTGANVYSMLQDYKSGFTAIKWQTWAKINGFNLNKRYNPDEEPMLEHIMDNLGYPLPSFYGERDRTVLQSQQVSYPKKR